jgi:hypothetical protein
VATAFETAAEALSLFEQENGRAIVLAANPNELATDDGSYEPVVEVSFRLVDLPGVFTVRVPPGRGWTAQAAERIQITLLEVLGIYQGNATGADVVAGYEPPERNGPGGV